ncbi:hexosaminidase [Crossiella equi]|uniref:beta-N-acetylhexosaminidase n=1 Tax=Crossiella equi TaxID=130796 RepID=A0ABS5AEN8_9PSEU|nr:beta-N-acetylhexosaminidase [Crossiella equi]MBP2475058.1 hexosaminidase [Crossiella equi]
MDFDVLLPRPVSAVRTEGEFVLRPGTAVQADPALAGAAAWLRQNLSAATGFPLDSSIDGVVVRFALDTTLAAEEYVLDIGPREVGVRAGALAGARHAAQSLRQLFGPGAFRRSSVHKGAWRLPAGRVHDKPRFAWRGVLLDVARHFLPKDGVLRYLDLLAAHKFSVLHLHLTDDQGWRMEVERYPRLTEVGAWRERSGVGPWQHGNYDGRPHGGFYTKDDLREIVGYAAGLGITVVPEVDVPGHTQAAIAAYPELGNLDQPIGVWTRWGINDNVLNVRDETVQFFKNVLDEVVEVFPSEVIGIGGDEVPLVQWRRSAEAQRRMAELGLSDEAGLHGWFLRQLAEHLLGHGRKSYCWDEIAEVGELPSGLVVASWRGEEAGAAAAEAGHGVVMCPEQRVYLDHRQSEHPEEPIPVGFVHTLTDVYGYEPVPEGLPPDAAANVLGAQANLWTEHLDSPRRLDYAAFPRLSAFSEVVWSPAGRDEADFLHRLTEHHLPRLAALGVEYRPLDGPRPWQRRPDVRGWPR